MDEKKQFSGGSKSGDAKFSGSLGGREKGAEPPKPAAGSGSGGLKSGPSGHGEQRKPSAADIRGQVGGIGGSGDSHGSKDFPRSPAGPVKQSSGCAGGVLALLLLFVLGLALLPLRLRRTGR